MSKVVMKCQYCPRGEECNVEVGLEASDSVTNTLSVCYILRITASSVRAVNEALSAVVAHEGAFSIEFSLDSQRRALNIRL